MTEEQYNQACDRLWELRMRLALLASEAEELEFLEELLDRIDRNGWMNQD